MPLESLLILGALALLVVLVALLLMRRPAADPAMGALQAALDRQAERLGIIQGELRGDIQRGTAALGEKTAGFTLEQSKAAHEGQAATRAALTEQKAALLDQMAALKRDLTQANGDLRTALAEGQAKQQKALAEEMVAARDLIDRKALESRAAVEARLKEMREANDARLADIQKSVNEQLQSAVEKQMTESFTRVIDQFNAIQAMMGNVTSVASQVGDLKRLFGNVKTRGGWGETQVKALLDDILPPGSYETNVKLRDDSADAVEFAVLMPTTGEQRVFLAVDAKFPVEDYERLLAAWDAADAVAEAQARRGLEIRVRGEAAKIAAKYVCPPRTVEFGVMYLPTEGLYAEIARIPGLIDDIGRTHRVMILGPSLLPAMLRTIQLGHVTLALSKNAEGVRDLLAATKAEMGKMDQVLASLGKQVGTVSNTIGRAQTRTRAIARKLRGVEVMPGDQAESLLEIGAAADEEDDVP
ncbi:MAG TPA: DNA recombination protein RmuC [Roseomonas sp.]|jgi:DNA recombination protein RmuC